MALQTLNDDLVLQMSSLKDFASQNLGSDIHAHVTSLQRERDSYHKEASKLRVEEDNLRRDRARLLLEVAQLNSEKDTLEQESHRLGAQNLGLQASLNAVSSIFMPYHIMKFLCVVTVTR